MFINKEGVHFFEVICILCPLWFHQVNSVVSNKCFWCVVWEWHLWFSEASQNFSGFVVLWLLGIYFPQMYIATIIR